MLLLYSTGFAIYKFPSYIQNKFLIVNIGSILDLLQEFSMQACRQPVSQSIRESPAMAISQLTEGQPTYTDMFNWCLLVLLQIYNQLFLFALIYTENTLKLSNTVSAIIVIIRNCANEKMLNLNSNVEMVTNTLP